MREISWSMSRRFAACLAVVLVAGPAAAARNPDDYLYRRSVVISTTPVAHVEFPSRVVYTTEAGFSRTVPVSVRMPPVLPDGRLPVVIVAHGGGEQPNDRDPATTLPEWGETLARAGYLVINVLHGTNVGADRRALCDAIGYEVPDPAEIIAVLQDIAAGIAAATPGADPVSIDLPAFLAAHPDLVDDLEDIVDDAEEETPVVRQVFDRLLDRLQSCSIVNGLGLWDRPYDIAAVVNALHDGVFPELDAVLDLDRVGLLGHSNGTSSTLNAVGLERALPNGVKVPAPFPAGMTVNPERRPEAVVALSPMGVNDYGLFDTAVWTPTTADSKEHSWLGLTDIPVMTLTGDGDNHCKTRFVCSGSDSAAKRRIPFERMPAGDKFLVFVADRFSTEIVSSHEMFGDLDRGDVCHSPSLATECANTVKWIKSSTIAFLDAYVAGEKKARAWLRSRALEKASAGIATIERK